MPQNPQPLTNPSDFGPKSVRSIPGPITHLSINALTDAIDPSHEIRTLIEQLQSVNTAGIEPMSHPLGGSQRLREDLANDKPDREAVMRNAPARQDGLFLVPRVIE